MREMGLQAGSDRKGWGSSGESSVRGISFFRFFPWAGGGAMYRLRTARGRGGPRTGSDCISSRHDPIGSHASCRYYGTCCF